MKKFIYLLIILVVYNGHANAQLTTQLNYTGSLQYWTVPPGVFEINITANGAQGGTTGSLNKQRGGYGAQTSGLFVLKPGDKLIILAGGMGSSDGVQASGGGGTFVLKEDNASPYQLPDGTKVTPLMIAGGGGGAYGTENVGNENKGREETEGGSTRASSPQYLQGGTDGDGGQGWNAGGGGGFLTDGIQLSIAGTNGKSFLSGGLGGTSPSAALAGGYGGGGAGYPGTPNAIGSADGGSGGGGGYSGGAGGRAQRGGGGGSYNVALPGTEENKSGHNPGNGFVLFSYSPSVLPVTLLSFSAKYKDVHTILQWNTTKEFNAAHFDIEKSADGKQFIKIGQVKATGSSSTIKSYSYVDQQPLSNDAHYRLKMVALDGATAYSRVIIMKSDVKANSLQVFPNPVQKELHVQTTLKGRLQVAIYDVKGRRVKEQMVSHTDNNIVMSLDVSDLFTGIYYVKVCSSVNIETASFLKQ